MRHYTRVLVLLLGGLLLSCAGACHGLVRWAAARDKCSVLAARLADGERLFSGEERALQKREAAFPQVRPFLQAWAPSIGLGGEGQDTASLLRNGMEATAQRKLGLVTDQVTCPEPGKVPLGGRGVFVQRVSMRVSGDKLSALLVWTGEIECQFPLARVEAVELQAGPGGNESLRLTLAQPVSRRGHVFPE